MPMVETDKSAIEAIKTEHQEAVADSEAEPRKKRGRPKGSKNRPKEQVQDLVVIPEAIVTMLIRMPYKLIANARGPHWEISEDEAKMMIPAHQALINRYVPDFLQKHVELYTVLLLHGMMIFARVEIDVRIAREEAEKKRGKPIESTEPIANVFGQKGYGQVNLTGIEVKPTT